jgi:hypothetical protein
MLSYKDFLFEKSSLNLLGVPEEVMKTIQYDFEFSPNINWVKSNDIKNLITSNLIMGVSEKFIFLIFSYVSNDNVLFNVDKYNYVEDDFGGGWMRETDLELKSNGIYNFLIDFKGDKYYTKDNSFKINPKKLRKIKEMSYVIEKDYQFFKKRVKENYSFISDIKKENSMSDLDEIIFDFEDDFSKKLNDYITISDIIQKYGMDKTLKLFDIYVKNNKILV